MELMWIKNLFKRYGKLRTFTSRINKEYDETSMTVSSNPISYQLLSAITNVNTEQRKRYMLAHKDLLNKSIADLYTQSDKVPLVNDLVSLDDGEWIIHEVINVYEANGSIQACKCRIIK